MQKTVYTPEEEQDLMAFLWDPAIADDPEKFVMSVFPWGVEGTPLAKKKGPRKWQRRFLRRIGEHIKSGRTAEALNLVAKMLRKAVASGRGIGKSATVSWLVLWFCTTRIGATAIVSANTEAQLRTITFAELAKWQAMALNSHWFEVSGIKMTPAKWLRELVERDLKQGTAYWGADGKLWSEENPDAYAGPHNHQGMMVIFDEGSGIPDPIWTVAAGYFTEPIIDRFWFAFSQGRRNDGYFHDCFNSKRDFWETENIDARTVEDTDPQLYQDIISEYGEDSDEARVEVYGQFPSSSDESFIPYKLVEEAAKRVLKDDPTAPIIIGVDPARGGSDWFTILIRQGRKILEKRRFKIKVDDDSIGTMEGVGHVIDAMEDYPEHVLVVVDETGMGGPILDRLKEQGYKRTRGVNFSWKAKNRKRWGNKRAEMWGEMKAWLATGQIPNEKRLKDDLTGPRKKPDSAGVILLESKKDMKARGLASPDDADALAVTFAFPVANPEYNERKAAAKASRGYHSDAPVTNTSWMGR